MAEQPVCRRLAAILAADVVGYPAAYAGLSETCVHDWFTGSPDGLDRALELALRASSLDPSLPLVLEALADARRIYPALSTAWVQTYLPYRRNADADRLIDGLRRAGLEG